MTVIAWDGKILAADKLANTSDMRRSVTKITKAPNGNLLFSAGSFDTITALYQWYNKAGNDDEFYRVQKENDWQPLNVIYIDGTIWRYERHPVPFKIEDKFITAGSGAHFAIAFLSMGLGAEEAVRRTIEFDPYSGGGIDVLSVSGMGMGYGG